MNDPLSCEQAKNLIPLHSGGDLEDAQDQRFIEAHLENCPSCRAEYEAFRDQREVFSRLRNRSLDPGFRKSFREDLRERLEDEPAPGPQKKTTSPTGDLFRKGFTPARAAAVLIIGLIISLAGLPLLQVPEDSRPSSEDTPRIVQPSEEAQTEQSRGSVSVPEERPGPVLGEQFGSGRTVVQPTTNISSSEDLPRGESYFLGESYSPTWEQMPENNRSNENRRDRSIGF